MELNYVDYLEIIAAMLTSIGGATVVILALGKWFGDILSKRVLDNYNNKHEEDLETLKSTYRQELEKTKVDLQKTKSLFIRYSEKQFDLYNDLWQVLLYTKKQADSLWQEATPEKIPSFSEQLRLTENAIKDNLLLIEEEHYEQLMILIEKFEQFQFGKIKLIDIRSKTEQEIKELDLSDAETKQTIDLNRDIKEEYDSIILKIGKNFREQLKG